MEGTKTIRIKSISEFHQLHGLPAPEHPLISVVHMEGLIMPPNPISANRIMDFYSISIKRTKNIKYKYGQQQYDFNEGVMFFMAPGQVLGIEVGKKMVKRTGWLLLIHPDFLWKTTLARSIHQYEFFDYWVNEALFLSQKEENTLTEILNNIEQEYLSNIDRFSQDIIIAGIELLLNYSQRFYNRQFITRKIANHQLLDKLEQVIDDYFVDTTQLEKGLPTVQYVAAALNVSPNYLSSMLKALTGQSTQQHIHEKLIAKAKVQLSTTELTVSEIAYELGFEHPQSFSKLFKAKQGQSPLEFRRSFN